MRKNNGFPQTLYQRFSNLVLQPLPESLQLKDVANVRPAWTVVPVLLVLINQSLVAKILRRKAVVKRISVNA